VFTSGSIPEYLVQSVARLRPASVKEASDAPANETNREGIVNDTDTSRSLTKSPSSMYGANRFTGAPVVVTACPR
jgi:hypothetical protein